MAARLTLEDKPPGWFHWMNATMPPHGPEESTIARVPPLGHERLGLFTVRAVAMCVTRASDCPMSGAFDSHPRKSRDGRPNVSSCRRLQTLQAHSKNTGVVGRCRALQGVAGMLQKSCGPLCSINRRCFNQRLNILDRNALEEGGFIEVPQFLAVGADGVE